MNTPSGTTIGLTTAIVIVTLIACPTDPRAQEKEQAVVLDSAPRA